MRAAATRLTLASLALSLSVGVAWAEPQRKVVTDHPGYRDYRKYCASCHGIFGDGQGPVAPVLKEPPSDLTRLGQRYGMPLPRNKLIPFIDGRDAKRAHGTQDMPVWGDVLHNDLSGQRDHQMAVRGTILVILDYLEEIQVPAEGESE